MARSFDYSKWDNIELSDDESDLHPNIDKDSWFRMKHRTRLEREEREDVEVQGMKQKDAEDNARLKLIEARIKGIQSGEAGEDAEFEDVDALQAEKKELEGHILQRSKRLQEINEKRSWTIDNICKTAEEKTIVNKKTSKSLTAEVPLGEVAKSDVKGNENVTEPPTTVFASTEATAASAAQPPTKPATTATTKPVDKPVVVTSVVKGCEPAAPVNRDRLAVISYNDYVIEHEQLLETYSEISDLEATKEFLFRNCDILLHEHAQSYMLLSCLEDEMNGKHKRMKLVCRQSQILSHIQELGVSMRRDPRDVILPFFMRIGEKEYLQGFMTAVEDFIKRIAKRAIEKRKEMDAERAEEAPVAYAGEDTPHALGPGGLDPFEVLKSLPKELREAFESQDIERLQTVLQTMDPVLAKKSMKRCVDSGLWMPQDKSIFESEELVDSDLEEVP